MSDIIDFTIQDCIGLVNNGDNIYEGSCMPDHKILSVKCRISGFVSLNEDRNLGAKNYNKIVREMPTNYMMSERAGRVIAKLINNFAVMKDEQNLVDQHYLELIELIDSEIKENVEPRPKGRKRIGTLNKPYWNTELSQLRKATKECNKELSHLKRVRASKSQIDRCKQKVRQSLSTFDRIHRAVRHKFNKRQQIEIEQANVNDPSSFWKFIKKLGPKARDIPWRVDNEDGSIITNQNDVLRRWTNDFNKLYQNSGEYDDDFLAHRIQLRDNLRK